MSAGNLLPSIGFVDDMKVHARPLGKQAFNGLAANKNAALSCGIYRF